MSTNDLFCSHCGRPKIGVNGSGGYYGNGGNSQENQLIQLLSGINVKLDIICNFLNKIEK